MASGGTQPNRDVRMRGFQERATVESCLEWVDAHAGPLDAEALPVTEAHGRVLAEDSIAACDVPGFDRSAMDGYALRGEETVGASSYNPLSLKLIGESMPGRPFSATLGRGQAVRIMTGAPVPEGADAVLPAEFAQEENALVHVSQPVPPGKHVGRRGEDVQAGTCVATKGRRLRPQDVGVLASVGTAQVHVWRRPRVRLVITGNELVPAGSPPEAFKIVDSNGPMLRALVSRDGGVALFDGLVPDQCEAVRAALLDPEADVVLVSGGSSVGAEDHAPLILAEEGELAIHGVAMRPSSPSGMGRIGERLVFLLPGNPVSCLCAYDFFAGRAIRRSGGLSAEFPYRTRTVRLRRKIASAVGRLDYVRVRIDADQAEPLAVSGSSILTSTTRADGFVIVPADSEGHPPGAEVVVHCYGP